MPTAICHRNSPRNGYLSDPERADRMRNRRENSLLVAAPLAQDCLKAIKCQARLIGVIGKLWELKTVARELFNLVNIEFEVDPDEPDEHFLIFNVTASGDIAEISARRREWHHRTQGFLGKDSGLVRLLIDVQ